MWIVIIFNGALIKAFTVCKVRESIHLFSLPVRRPQPQRPQFGVGGGGGGGAASATAVFTQQPGGVQPRMSQEGKPQQTAAFGTCSMPGCPFPKRIDGDRVHNYCSRTCAQKHRDVQASSSGYQQKVVTLLQYGMLAHFMNTWDYLLYFLLLFFFCWILYIPSGGPGIPSSSSHQQGEVPPTSQPQGSKTKICSSPPSGGLPSSALSTSAPPTSSPSLCRQCNKRYANPGRSWCQQCYLDSQSP